MPTKLSLVLLLCSHMFASELLPSKLENAKHIGTTRFTHDERMKAGSRMIEAYHRIFWNCQDFARLFLHVLTDGAANWNGRLGN